MPVSHRERRKHFWFGILFIIAGLIPAGLVGVCVWDWQRSGSWVEAEAEILSVDVNTKTTSGSRGRSSSSLVFVAEYQYQPTFAAESYQSDGISPFYRIEFFESYTIDEAARLRTALRDGETVTCYVNPEDPHEAFLNRDFRWRSSLILCGVAMLFSGVGALIALRARDPNYEPPVSRMC